MTPQALHHKSVKQTSEGRSFNHNVLNFGTPRQASSSRSQTTKSQPSTIKSHKLCCLRAAVAPVVQAYRALVKRSRQQEPTSPLLGHRSETTGKRGNSLTHLAALATWESLTMQEALKLLHLQHKLILRGTSRLRNTRNSKNVRVQRRS